MNYTLAVFRARTQTLLFVKLLNSYGIAVSVINTPRNLNISCGISAKFASIYLNIAEDIIRRRRFDSFAGFYSV
ncbi:MAG: DUF3343 domain-containing protein [Clostridia bacterium]|nr:DUF3343 domain-containing protein [Clostridia bacterium]